MKSTIFYLLILTWFFCTGCDNNLNSTIKKSYQIDKWEFREAGNGEWLSAVVPGSVHSDLLRNGKIEAPYYRTNEKNQQWIDKKDWDYRSTFKVDDSTLKQDQVYLEFEGLDTYADVYLNDSLVLQTDNMFRLWRVPVKNLLNQQENLLQITFKSPTLTGEKLLEAHGYGLPASNDQSENGEMGDKKVSVFVRKAPYHFGWDWGPRFVTSGIWKPIKLVGYTTAELKDIWIVQNNLSAEEALMEAEVELDAIDSAELKLVLLVNGEKMAENLVKVASGNNKFPLEFIIQEPKLWWSNGLGEANLYQVKVQLLEGNALLDEVEVQTGIRTARWVQEPDPAGKGKSFYLELNGRPVFAKGANYIPNDVFLDQVTPEKYEHIIRSAVESNMNMIRVWGGGVYEKDIFYELCDRNGIMVWQDFMFACSMYPGDSAFLANVKAEAIDNVKRLRNHPSIVLWCGNNEIETAWGQYEDNAGWGWKKQYTAEQQEEIWSDYDKLFHQLLPDVVAEYTNYDFYWHSSPSAGMGLLSSPEKEAGDMHYWGVWHELHPFEDFNVYRSRFMSEYGFQSFPLLETVKKYTIPEDWNIETEVMAAHQRSGIGNLRIRQYMEQDYQVPADFEQFLYVGQLLQARGINMAIEAHRRDMPYCMGSLYWQLNDCWPVASWSSMDYYGNWKALQYSVQEDFKPVILSVRDTSDVLEFFIISDATEPVSGQIELRLIDFYGSVVWERSMSLDLPENTSKNFLNLPKSELPENRDWADLVLVAKLKNGEELLDQALHYLVKPKDLQLPTPEINLITSARGDNWLIEVTSPQLVKNLFLDAGEVPGRFSNNFFDLLPGDTVRISFPAIDTPENFKDKIRIMHLEMTMKKDNPI
jgi:beta-mannosidase